jgi:hypothetical protein
MLGIHNLYSRKSAVIDDVQLTCVGRKTQGRRVAPDVHDANHTVFGFCGGKDPVGENNFGLLPGVAD